MRAIVGKKQLRMCVRLPLLYRTRNARDFFRGSFRNFRIHCWMIEFQINEVLYYCAEWYLMS